MTKQLQLVPRGGNYIQLNRTTLGDLGQIGLGSIDLSSVNPMWWIAAGIGAALVMGMILRPGVDAGVQRVRRARSKRYGLGTMIGYIGAAGAAGYLYGRFKAGGVS